MQFRDLQKQYQLLKAEIDQAIQKVLMDGNFISGHQVTELEHQLASYTGVKHCITCANGTDALTLALMVWNIGPGDAVFVPDFTFFASGETPAYEGAVPVFVDVERDTFNMSPGSLEEAIVKIEKEGKLIPRVIITVDLFGQPADYQDKRNCEKTSSVNFGRWSAGIWRSYWRTEGLQFWGYFYNVFFSGKTLGMLWGWRCGFYR